MVDLSKKPTSFFSAAIRHFFFFADHLKCGRKRQQDFAGTLILKIVQGVNTLLAICMGDRGSYVICSWLSIKLTGNLSCLFS